jgi:hypothetical protein
MHDLIRMFFQFGGLDSWYIGQDNDVPLLIIVSVGISHGQRGFFVRARLCVCQLYLH